MNENTLNGIVLGRLAKSEEVAEFRSKGGEYDGGAESVFNGRVLIKPLSKLPYNQSELAKNDLYACFTSFCEIFENRNEYEIEQMLQNTYVSFTPIYNYETNKYHKSRCEALQVINNIRTLFDENKTYVPIPIVEIERFGLKDFDELEKYLVAGYRPLQPIVLSEAYEDMPYIFIAYTVQPHNAETFVYRVTDSRVESKKPIITVDLPNKNKAKVDMYRISKCGIYNNDNGLIFLPEDEVLRLYNEINEQNGITKVEKLELYRQGYHTSSPMENKAFWGLDDMIDKNALRPDSEPIYVKAKNNTVNEYHSKEVPILDEFKKKANGNFLYDDKDIINFDLCVNTSKFVILSGISGTGKSQLVRTYADVLCAVDGISDKNNRLIIPVSPSWTDDSDILGFVDYEKNMYQTADTGLVDFLITASENPKRKYIVCFDEMNLAKVEHYFSQFISILELPEEERLLRLYSDKNTKMISNYPPTIHILDNVCFVGTVNIDESTTPISDKMLDRANKIELDIQPFTKMKDMLDNKLSDEELRLLTELHNAIHNEEPKLGIGYRIVRQMADYLDKVDSYGNSFTRSEGIDYVVTQRIVSKLRGSAEQVGNLVSSVVISIFDNYNALSDFAKARELLGRKAKELETYGYTI